MLFLRSIPLVDHCASTAGIYESDNRVRDFATYSNVSLNIKRPETDQTRIISTMNGMICLGLTAAGVLTGGAYYWYTRCIDSSAAKPVVVNDVNEPQAFPNIAIDDPMEEISLELLQSNNVEMAEDTLNDDCSSIFKHLNRTVNKARQTAAKLIAEKCKGITNWITKCTKTIANRSQATPEKGVAAKCKQFTNWIAKGTKTIIVESLLIISHLIPLAIWHLLCIFIFVIISLICYLLEKPWHAAQAFYWNIYDWYTYQRIESHALLVVTLKDSKEPQASYPTEKAIEYLPVENTKINSEMPLNYLEMTGGRDRLLFSANSSQSDMVVFVRQIHQTRNGGTAPNDNLNDRGGLGDNESNFKQTSYQENIFQLTKMFLKKILEMTVKLTVGQCNEIKSFIKERIKSTSCFLKMIRHNYNCLKASFVTTFQFSFYAFRMKSRKATHLENMRTFEVSFDGIYTQNHELDSDSELRGDDEPLFKYLWCEAVFRLGYNYNLRHTCSL